MTSFTDEDLERLKKCKLDELLLRLETAEMALYHAEEYVRGGIAGGDVTYG